MACPDPVVFFEPKRRYWDKVEVDTSQVLREAADAPHPMDRARVVRPGADVSVLCYGPMVRTCLAAADALAAEGGADVEVLDLRSLSPLDLDAILGTARRTGRVVVVHEAPVTLGLGAEIAARVQEACFYSLEAPVLRVGGFSTPYPASKVEDEYLPDLDRVLDAVDRVLAH